MDEEKIRRAIARVGEEVWLPEFASSEELANMQSALSDDEISDMVNEVDAKVRPIVLDLTRSGYATSYSCQGGSGHEWSYALIGLDGDFVESAEDRRRVRAIIRRHTRVPFRLYEASGSMLGDYVVRFKGAL